MLSDSGGVSIICILVLDFVHFVIRGLNSLCVVVVSCATD